MTRPVHINMETTTPPHCLIVSYFLNLFSLSTAYGVILLALLLHRSPETHATREPDRIPNRPDRNPNHKAIRPLFAHTIKREVENHLNDALSSNYGPISSWDTSRVNNMSNLFQDRQFFNEDISQWDVSNVTSMQRMFLNANAFNGDISQWDVSNVIVMTEMFQQATAFNGDIGEWDVTKVVVSKDMFRDARSFNGNLNKWKVSNISNMSGMFLRATFFNSNLSQWDVSKVSTMGWMFVSASSFNGDLIQWDVSNVKDMYGMFWRATSFNTDISQWDVSKLTKMDDMFFVASSFNSNISQWNVSNVNDMYWTFREATHFNSDLSRWDVSNVSNMNGTFYDASSFHADLTKWDVSKVSNMRNMFKNSQSFTSDLSQWDVSNVTDMENLFWGASVFNGDISAWDVSNVTNMVRMFSHGPFNRNLNQWNVSQVTDMFGMFWKASKFNGDISQWDISNVVQLRGMFYSASNFNADVSAWDVSKVTDMRVMFRDATSFNSDMNEWDVSSVFTMDKMFKRAMSFDQELCWNITASTEDLLLDTAGSLLPYPDCLSQVTTSPTVSPTILQTQVQTQAPLVGLNQVRIVSSLSTKEDKWCMFPMDSALITGTQMTIVACDNKKQNNTMDSYQWTIDYEGKFVTYKDPTLCMQGSGRNITLETCVDGFYDQRWIYSLRDGRIIPLKGLRGIVTQKDSASDNVPVKLLRYDENIPTDPGIWMIRYVTGSLVSRPIYDTFLIKSDLPPTNNKRWCLYPAKHEIIDETRVAISICRPWKGYRWTMDVHGRVSMFKDPNKCMEYLNKKVYITTCTNSERIRQRWVYNVLDKTLIPLNDKWTPLTVLGGKPSLDGHVKLLVSRVPTPPFQAWTFEQI